MNSISLSNILGSLLLLLLLGGNELKAQKSEAEIKAGSSVFMNPAGLTEDLPFWLHANREGVVNQSYTNFIGYLSGTGIYRLNENFSIEGGLDFYTQPTDRPAFFNKAYTKIQGYNFILSAGKFTDPLAQKENELSTGSFMYSHNASPIPKIAFHTDGFVGVPWTNGIVRYKGLFAHGWFDQDRFVKNVYLHEKYFYLSFGHNNINFEAGIVHNVQWGGNSVGTAENTGSGRLPTGFGTFIDVVTASASGDPNAPTAEQTNVVGNSNGAYDFNLSYNFETFSLELTKQIYLEDKVSARLRSQWDGKTGLTFTTDKFSFIQNAIWEHVNTKKQDSFSYEPFGTAKYYNHYIYRTGWTYQGRVIGNPLILSDGNVDAPIYNNIIIAHHLGVSGEFMPDLSYKFLYTYSRNYGEFEDQIIEKYPPDECPKPSTVCGEFRPLNELKKINHSFYLELRSNLPGQENISYAVALASDFGALYGNRFGLMANIEYQLLSK